MNNGSFPYSPTDTAPGATFPKIFIDNFFYHPNKLILSFEKGIIPSEAGIHVKCFDLPMSTSKFCTGISTPLQALKIFENKN